MRTTRFRTALLLVAVAALALFGAVACTEENNYESPTGPELISIRLDGQCRPAPSVVVCEDRTTTEPAGKLSAVTFQLRSATTGLSFETKAVNASATPPREVPFAGVPAGSYLVEHVATATNGTLSRATYGPLTVPSSE